MSQNNLFENPANYTSYKTIDIPKFDLTDDDNFDFEPDEETGITSFDEKTRQALLYLIHLNRQQTLIQKMKNKVIHRFQNYGDCFLEIYIEHEGHMNMYDIKEDILEQEYDRLISLLKKE
jgi:hypothetical protein